MMKTRGSWSLLLTSLALTACASSMPHSMQSSAPAYRHQLLAQAPEFQAGQRWEFRRIDLWTNRVREHFSQELIGREGAYWHLRWQIAESDNVLRRGSLTSEWMAVDTHGFTDRRREGGHLPLSFPLGEGKRWNFRYAYHAPSGALVEVDQAASVQGWETVQVPAGRFDALKVVHLGYYRATLQPASWNGRIEETYWYVPDLKRIVKVEYRDTQADGATWDQWRDELVDYRFAAATRDVDP